MCLILLITESFLVAYLDLQRVNPANSLSYYFVSRFKQFHVFSPLLHLLFLGQESETFALLFTGISHFIFICCYCNWTRAFVQKRARFIRFCLHNIRTVRHNFNQFIANQPLFLLLLLLLGYILLRFVLTFRSFVLLQLQFLFHILPSNFRTISSPISDFPFHLIF